MNDAGVIFNPNFAGIAALKTALLGATKKGLDNAFKVLRVSAEEYRRRVQRVTPVETGRLRGSWVVQTERTKNMMTAVVGTSMKAENGAMYPVALEFGTDRIAKGKVKAWSEGEPPILEWPAKMQDIPNFFKEKDTKKQVWMPSLGKHVTKTEKGVGEIGSAKFERSVKIATKAMTFGEGEQMPMLRPIGYEMAPRILDAVLRAIHNGLADGLDGKKF